MIEIGDRVRCCVGDNGMVKTDGTVRYVEKVHHNFGVWVGVELDWPKGSGDGVFTHFSPVDEALFHRHE